MLLVLILIHQNVLVAWEDMLMIKLHLLVSLKQPALKMYAQSVHLATLLTLMNAFNVIRIVGDAP